jgi:hypothetical protein
LARTVKTKSLVSVVQRRTANWSLNVPNQQGEHPILGDAATFRTGDAIIHGCFHGAPRRHLGLFEPTVISLTNLYLQ